MTPPSVISSAVVHSSDFSSDESSASKYFFLIWSLTVPNIESFTIWSFPRGSCKSTKHVSWSISVSARDACLISTASLLEPSYSCCFVSFTKPKQSSKWRLSRVEGRGGNEGSRAQRSNRRLDKSGQQKEKFDGKENSWVLSCSVNFSNVFGKVVLFIASIKLWSSTRTFKLLKCLKLGSEEILLEPRERTRTSPQFAFFFSEGRWESERLDRYNSLGRWSVVAGAEPISPGGWEKRRSGGSHDTSFGGARFRRKEASLPSYHL